VLYVIFIGITGNEVNLKYEYCPEVEAVDDGAKTPYEDVTVPRLTPYEVSHRMVTTTFDNPRVKGAALAFVFSTRLVPSVDIPMETV
jgi:hypothetical protein